MLGTATLAHARMLDGAGASLAWLAELIWYATTRGYVSPQDADLPGRLFSTEAMRSVAAMVWLLSVAGWCTARGTVMGLACTVVASVVAASIQRPLAAMFPRIVIISGGLAATLALASVLVATSGA